jgi:hypothetical protein
VAPSECISALGGWESFEVCEWRQDRRGAQSWCVLRLRRDRSRASYCSGCWREAAIHDVEWPCQRHPRLARPRQPQHDEPLRRDHDAHEDRGHEAVRTGGLRHSQLAPSAVAGRRLAAPVTHEPLTRPPPARIRTTSCLPGRGLRQPSVRCATTVSLASDVPRYVPRKWVF